MVLLSPPAILEFAKVKSAFLLIRMEAKDVAMFRFLLESYENLALFTTLEKRPALLKLIFADGSGGEVIAALKDIGRSLPLAWEDWPIAERNGGANE